MNFFDLCGYIFPRRSAAKTALVPEKLTRILRVPFNLFGKGVEAYLINVFHKTL